LLAVFYRQDVSPLFYGDIVARLYLGRQGISNGGDKPMMEVRPDVPSLQVRVHSGKRIRHNNHLVTTGQRIMSGEWRMTASSE
jgi:hypothetical protein